MKVNLEKEDLVRLICGSDVPEKYVRSCLDKGLIKDVSDFHDGGPIYQWCCTKLMKRNERKLIIIYENIVGRKIVDTYKKPDGDMSELEYAIHRRLNLLNGEEMTTDELMAETKGMAAELTDIFKKNAEIK